MEAFSYISGNWADYIEDNIPLVSVSISLVSPYTVSGNCSRRGHQESLQLLCLPPCGVNLPTSVVRDHDCLVVFPATQATLGLFSLQSGEVCLSLKYSLPDKHQAFFSSLLSLPLTATSLQIMPLICFPNSHTQLPIWAYCTQSPDNIMANLPLPF